MIINNEIRNGNFTSSEIFAILTEGKTKGTWGKPALTYIDECNMERRLGRSLTSESNARPLIWGRVLEEKCFELLGTEYKLCSQTTLQHPDIPYWVGSPDGVKFDIGGTVIDEKCPMTLKSFCNLVDPLYEGLTGMDAMNKIRETHKDGEKFYWQLISNGILTKSKYAELIVYVPYQNELESIREITQNWADDPNPVAWINFAADCELPYLHEGGYYKNINIIRFEIPESDKILLTQKVIEAGKMLKTKI